MVLESAGWGTSTELHAPNRRQVSKGEVDDLCPALFDRQSTGLAAVRCEGPQRPWHWQPLSVSDGDDAAMVLADTANVGESEVASAFQDCGR